MGRISVPTEKGKTMTEREKLIELLRHEFNRIMEGNPTTTQEFADNLIANGVTIPVQCKDCQSSHYNECSGLTKCTSQRGLHRIVDPNEHCSWGERKDNGN